eukprot:TRINITY_DN4102_c0_g1_i2.p1 TRINITY_DN4102_c0_g1~~TRINITY_DN4102_c0_g1_i2.p1  ORF type:complete len:662 (+),score=124.81 TRINITY_DN4102_c0_g1_i2:42-2027(+)
MSSPGFRAKSPESDVPRTLSRTPTIGQVGANEKSRNVSIGLTRLALKRDPTAPPSTPLSARKLPEPPKPQVESSVDEEQSKVVMRSKVLQEIITTEATYIKDLDVLINSFMKPLISKYQLPRESVQSIFSNVETIYGVNKQIAGRLETSQNEVGEIYLSMAPYLKMYSSYCHNHTEALSHLSKLEKKRKDIAQFLLDTAERECHGLFLKDYLIKPIQRLCKYPLLFSNLLQNTSKDSKEYQNIEETLTLVNAIVLDINESKTKSMKFQEIVELEPRISEYPGSIISPDRKLEKEIRVMIQSGKAANSVVSHRKANAQERVLLIFNDKIIFCKKSNKTDLVFKFEVGLWLVNIVDFPNSHPGKMNIVKNKQTCRNVMTTMTKMTTMMTKMTLKIHHELITPLIEYDIGLQCLFDDSRDSTKSLFFENAKEKNEFKSLMNRVIPDSRVFKDKPIDERDGEETARGEIGRSTSKRKLKKILTGRKELSASSAQNESKPATTTTTTTTTPTPTTTKTLPTTESSEEIDMLGFLMGEADSIKQSENNIITTTTTTTTTTSTPNKKDTVKQSTSSNKLTSASSPKSKSNQDLTSLTTATNTTTTTTSTTTESSSEAITERNLSKTNEVVIPPIIQSIPREQLEQWVVYLMRENFALKEKLHMERVDD